jgi:hypothetical protein
MAAKVRPVKKRTTAAKGVTAFTKRVANALSRLTEDFEIDSVDSKNFDKMLRAQDLDPQNPEHVRAVAVTIWGAVFAPGPSGAEGKWKGTYNLHDFFRDFWRVREQPDISSDDAAYTVMRTKDPWQQKYGHFESNGPLRGLFCEANRDPTIKLLGKTFDGSLLRNALNQILLYDRRFNRELSEEEWNRDCRDKFLAAKTIVEAFSGHPLGKTEIQIKPTLWSKEKLAKESRKLMKLLNQSKR